MQANFGENELKDLLGKVKIFNNEIGDYQLFMVNESFNYFVKLSNGSIIFSIDNLLDNQNQTLTPEKLLVLASKFNSSVSEPKKEEHSTNNQTDNKNEEKTTRKHPPVYQNVPKKSGNKKVVIISFISLIILATGIFLINWNEGERNRFFGIESGSNSYENLPSSNDNYAEESSYEEPKEKTEKELKRELAIRECENPTKYLSKSNQSINGIYKNALSVKFNGFKLKFKINNSASIITFKNVKCRVTLKSNSGASISSKSFTVYEFVQAGSSVFYTGEFECTNQEFKDTRSYALEILGAECH